MDYPISAREYTLFMRCLYNATYLTIPNSEYATELLSTCDFTNGFSKGFPLKTKMAHKFGEARFGDEHELHESGIIYINNKAFVITIMTRGKNFDKLPEIIQQSSAIIYQYISKIT